LPVVAGGCVEYIHAELYEGFFPIDRVADDDDVAFDGDLSSEAEDIGAIGRDEIADEGTGLSIVDRD